VLAADAARDHLVAPAGHPEVYPVLDLSSADHERRTLLQGKAQQLRLRLVIEHDDLPKQRARDKVLERVSTGRADDSLLLVQTRPQQELLVPEQSLEANAVGALPAPSEDPGVPLWIQMLSAESVFLSELGGLVARNRRYANRNELDCALPHVPVQEAIGFTLDPWMQFAVVLELVPRDHVQLSVARNVQYVVVGDGCLQEVIALAHVPPPPSYTGLDVVLERVVRDQDEGRFAAL